MKTVFKIRQTLLSLLFIGILALPLMTSCDDEGLEADDTTLISFDIDGRIHASAYLMHVRSYPSYYSDSLGIDLSQLERRNTLRMSDTLNNVAKNKVTDMIRRNYFGLIDPDGNGVNVKMDLYGYALKTEWLADKTASQFAAIWSCDEIPEGEDVGEYIMKQLIIDNDHEDLRNRDLLLGISDFNADMTDYGLAIGSNAGSQYKYYVCIIVAKHE